MFPSLSCRKLDSSAEDSPSGRVILQPEQSHWIQELPFWIHISWHWFTAWIWYWPLGEGQIWPGECSAFGSLRLYLFMSWAFTWPWQLFEHVLSELGPWCLAEQDFCVRFFNLDPEPDSPPQEVGFWLICISIMSVSACSYLDHCFFCRVHPLSSLIYLRRALLSNQPQQSSA